MERSALHLGRPEVLRRGMQLRPHGMWRIRPGALAGMGGGRRIYVKRSHLLAALARVERAEEVCAEREEEVPWRRIITLKLAG